MKLQTFILHQTPTVTISSLHINGDFFCFVCEDGYREKKVPGETRISAGTYKIAARTEGKFFLKYRQAYGHAFAIWIKDVPEFEYILMRIGNDPTDTRGYLLVGMSWRFTGQSHYVSESSIAYRKLYDQVEAAFICGEKVTIEINRETSMDAMHSLLSAV